MRLNPVPVILLSITATLVGQSAGPKFDVAVVKPARLQPEGTRDGRMVREPGRVTFEYVSLQNLISFAYKIKIVQISGPGWLDSERFDIVATFPREADEDRFAKMLQEFLAERFRLLFHREQRTLTAWVLTRGKSTFKLKPLAEDVGDVRSSLNAGRGHVAGKMTVPYLAGVLSNLLNRPVIDNTGVQGVFHFDLTWSTGDAVETPGDELASLPTALEQTTGLHIDSGKTPVEVYVIDHVDRVPTAN